MLVHYYRSVGWIALAYTVALLSRGATAVGGSGRCIPHLVSNGRCDYRNNMKACGYDGGDCCQQSCVDGPYVCGKSAGFDCVDPDYLDSTKPTYRNTYSCDDDLLGNGNCDFDQNIEECGYDGGDCCYCTCSTPKVATNFYICGFGDGYDCVDPSALCVDDDEYVEAGTVTTVTALADDAFDTRHGQEHGYYGCTNTGCVPKLTRDGDADNIESRWACRQRNAPDEEDCQITFQFAEEQDVRYIQVAFKEAEENPRALNVRIDGVLAGQMESSSETTFTRFDLYENGAESVSLTTSGLNANEWIHILEVRILVEPADY